MKFGVGYVFGLLSVSVMACDAPVLNHRYPDPNLKAQGHRASMNSEGNTSCPLSFPSAHLCASLTWDHSPTQEEDNPFKLRFWSADQGTESGPYVNPEKTVFAKLWMPSMGHGSSPIKLSPSRDSSGDVIPGIFEASQVYFIMGGAWEVRVQLRAGTRVDEESIFSVSL